MTLDAIRMGEHETIEYKKDIPAEKEKFLKTAVAFANGNGGKLVFGVQDTTWDVIGFPNEELFVKMDAITNSIYDSCTPKIVPQVEIQEVEGKHIIVATIHPGMEKPYYLTSQGMMDGTYIRISGTTRKADPQTIQELCLDGSNRSFDQMRTGVVVSDQRIRKLCNRMYQHALSNDLGKTGIRKITKNQMLSWKLLVAEGNDLYATNGFLLLEGDEKAFPEACIQCAEFKGTDRSVFLDRKEINGPLDVQVEDATNFVMQHIRMGSRIDGVYRKDIYELPIDSVREMIANAVCHRSYVRHGKIQVALYENRLEVTSPGRLSDELSIEDLKKGNSLIRNKAIATAFAYMHVIESWGTGIPRIMQEAKDYGLGEVQFDNMGVSFRITLARKPFATDQYGVVNPTQSTQSTQSSQFSQEERQILELLKNEPEIGQSQIACRLQWNVNKVKYYLHKFRLKGILQRTGTNRQGRWVLTL